MKARLLLVALALLLALLPLQRAHAAGHPAPTPTASPTDTPFPSPTAAPSATATATPSPTPPPGPQAGSGNMVWCFPFAGCFNLIEFVNSVLGGVMSWFGSIFAPALGLPPPTVATPAPTPRATPSALPTPAASATPDDLVRDTLNVSVAEPDFTSPQFATLNQYGQAFAKLGEALFALAVLCYILEAGASYLTSGGRRLGAIILALVLGRLYLSALSWAEGGLYTFMGDLAQYAMSQGPGIHEMESTITGLLTGVGNTPIDMADFTFNTFAAIGIFGAEAIVLLLVDVTRMSGIYLLALFHLIGPIFVALYLMPGMSRLANWWLRSWLQYLIWAPVYAVLLQATLIVLFGLASDPVFGNPFIRAIEGMSAASVLLAVPRLTAGIGGMTARGMSGMDVIGKAKGLLALL